MAVNFYNVTLPESVAAANAVFDALLWNPIDNSQAGNWVIVANSQNPNWFGVDDSQSPNWQNINS
jgi:hypothetical protein